MQIECDQAADRQAADDGLADGEVVEQGGEVGGVGGDARRRVAEAGQAMAALVIDQRRAVTGEAADDIVPDAEVGAQRID